ncbi:MAG: arginine--tRNA ligase, partial [Clostridia bacterium]|nr:arginine--tRNA ligase [Clostridia bacterium]
IGEAMKRLTRVCGHKAIGDVHLGDWGTPMGLVIEELHDRHPEWRCFAEDFDPETDTVPTLDAASLNEIYPFASARKKEDADFRDRAHATTFELQKGRPGYIALWKEILKVSVADIRTAYEKLNVDFEYWYGESDADKYVPELMDILTEKSLLRESDGALVIDVAREEDTAPMPPIIARKTDGSITYETTDLATILQRQRDFAPDRMLYLTDARQGLHFEQVFRAARLAGLTDENVTLDFLGFGTMNGADGKPYKTRDGGVMQLNDLLATATNAAYEKLAASTYLSELDEEEKQVLARKVGIAAVKFGDLVNNPTRDYVFDLDKFLAFEGKTGTYLLYTVTRINSVLKKAGDAEGAVAGLYSDTERELVLKLLLSGDVFRRALAEKAPSFLCDNAYQLASVFSKFYHDNRVIDESDEVKKASWLALMALVRRVLLLHLDTLAIDAVENM